MPVEAVPTIATVEFIAPLRRANDIDNVYS